MAWVDVKSSDTSNPVSMGGGVGNGKTVTFTNGVPGWMVAAVAAIGLLAWLKKKG